MSISTIQQRNMMTGNFLFTIVIPTCDRTEELRNCLECLAPECQKFSADLYEIVVTDDGRKNSSKELIEKFFPTVKYVKGPQLGPAANRNNGVKFASGEWIIFIDDDCLPDPGLIGAYHAALQDQPAVRVFEGRIMADREKRHPFEECPINEYGGNLWSCNFAIQRELFENVGGFDNRFPNAAGEDWELCYNLRKHGFMPKFTHEALVIHPWRKRDLRGHLAQNRRTLSAILLTIGKHEELRSVFTPWNVFKDIIRYYVRNFASDIKKCGIRAVIYNPIFLYNQSIRIRAFSSDSKKCGNADYC